jgi:hypothetical protein
MRLMLPAGRPPTQISARHAWQEPIRPYRDIESSLNTPDCTYGARLGAQVRSCFGKLAFAIPHGLDRIFDGVESWMIRALQAWPLMAERRNRP